METLRGFLDRREAEVRDALKSLKAEQAELKRVRAALDGTDTAAREALGEDDVPTIKDMIRGVLQGAATGLSSNDMIATIEMSFGPALERTSLSPQLSRLRRDEEVILEDGKWFPGKKLKPFSVAGYLSKKAPAS